MFTYKATWELVGFLVCVCVCVQYRKNCIFIPRTGLHPGVPSWPETGAAAAEQTQHWPVTACQSGCQTGRTGICKGNSGNLVISFLFRSDNVGRCVSLTQQHRGPQPQSEWILSPQCGEWRTKSKTRSKSLKIMRHIYLYLLDKITIKSWELHFKCSMRIIWWQVMGNYRLL